VLKNCLSHWYILLLCLVTTVAAATSGSEGIQLYQKNVHLSAEYKQRLAEDITRYRNADNLWDALREEFTLPHYEDHPAVQAKIEWFMNNQDFLLRSATRAAPYLYYISQQVKKRHLPAELVLLPIIESGYNPNSLSTAGALGIWQLMPQTATGLGVRRDMQYDGRRDVIASTRAALNYLAYLQNFFDGNWLYAIAAYNTGEGNVLSAIKRNIRDGIDTNFWSLPVAQQTKDYVPSLLALAVIISHPEKYPVYFPPVRNAPYLGQVDVGRQISLKYAAQLAGLSFKRLSQLNSGYRNATSSKGQYKLTLPIENVATFTENLSYAKLNESKINWIHYKVKTGDTLASIASRYDTTTTAIRQLNHISKRGLSHGNTILIPTAQIAEADDDSVSLSDKSVNIHKTKIPSQKTDFVTIASRATSQDDDRTPFDLGGASGSYRLKPGDTIYMVRQSDTVDGIARRFHINARTLRAANDIDGAKFKPGKQIIIPTHARGVNEELNPGDTIYMVRRGDTIEKVAQRFRTTSSEIRIANLMLNNSVREGDRLIIPAHARG
jgi:membrane-bound lytic murein transglycosylase D